MFFGDTETEKFFECAPEGPVVAELAEAVEVGLAHVAAKAQLVSDRVKMNPVFQLGGEFDTFRKPIEFDEVIHGILHHGRDADARLARRESEIEENGSKRPVTIPANGHVLSPVADCASASKDYQRYDRAAGTGARWEPANERGRRGSQLPYSIREYHNCDDLFRRSVSLSERPTTMTHGRVGIVAASATAILVFCSLVVGQDEPKVGFTDTPMLPGGKWHVHDGNRPMPVVITPGTCSTQEKAGTAPSDAVVLFDGTDLSHWRSRSGKPAAWKVDDGALVIAPGSGEIVSKDEFGDCQLHLEFAAPVPPRGRDQGRGNSGLMFFARYEIQVLDSYENRTYADGQAAAIYGQFPPLVNASRPPGQWQTYDIIFRAPRFRPDRSLESPAYVTMLHNGVLVHDHRPLIGAMAYRAVGKYTPHGPKGPILLQDHGNPVRFRNIWVRELKEPEPALSSGDQAPKS